MIQYMKVSPLGPELLGWRDKIKGIAESEGLDFFETRFEMVSYDKMSEIAAYGGFPTRYPHWRFGMEYERLSKSHTYGLSKIYELVINSNPCYAYLLEGNELVDQKLVMAHVYSHCDFFKNNFWFSRTDRKMLDTMANHATQVRRYQSSTGSVPLNSLLILVFRSKTSSTCTVPIALRRRGSRRKSVKIFQMSSWERAQSRD